MMQRAVSERTDGSHEEPLRRGSSSQNRSIGTANGLLTLQQAAGNRAVLGLLNRSSADVRSPTGNLIIQRSCCAECATGEACAGDGQTLPQPTRVAMEERLGADLSTVRIHSGTEAGQSALSLAARAYTAGNDIVFAPGQYAPETDQGRELLTHELAHVIQQRRTPTVLDANSGRPAGSMTTLEAEADQVAKAVAGGSSDRQLVVPRGAAAPQASLFSELTDLLGLSFDALAGRALSATADDALIGNVAQLRAEILSAGLPVSLPAEVIQSMTQLRGALAAEAPSWLRLPDTRVEPPVTAAVTIPVAAALIALILLVFLVLMWLLQRANPTIRRSQDRAIEDLIRKIREGTKRKPDPDPDPRDPRRPPFPGPDVDTDEDEEHNGCRIKSVPMRFGRVPCHADFAWTFSGVRREFDVTTPEGLTASFDARNLVGMLFEVKTGYGWLLNQNLPPVPWEERRKSVHDRFIAQAAQQQAVADRCHMPLEWYFNSKAVADYFEERGMLPTRIRSRAFNCATDSDHTW